MPYDVVEREGQYCVRKVDDGTIMGCHDTHAEAVQQIAAIESNEKGLREDFRITFEELLDD